jgi:NADH-quinone oxidoreductase subunit B
LQKKIDGQALTGAERPRHLNADEPSEFVVPKYGAHDLEPAKNVKLWNILPKTADVGSCMAGKDESGKD